MKNLVRVFRKRTHVGNRISSRVTCLLLCVMLITGALSPTALAALDDISGSAETQEKWRQDLDPGNSGEIDNPGETDDPVVLIETGDQDDPFVLAMAEADETGRILTQDAADEESAPPAFEEITTYSSNNGNDLQWYLGAVNNQYIISTQSELRGLADIVNGNVTLYTVYLEYGEVLYENETSFRFDFAGRIVSLGGDIAITELWQSIGTIARPFRGTFDGAFQTISGLRDGLFGAADGHVNAGPAGIRNLMLTDVSILGSDSVGALLLNGTNVIISNCAVIGNVTGTGVNAGGLAGNLDSRSVVRNSYCYDPTGNLPAAGGSAQTENTYTFLNTTQEQFENGIVAYLVDGGGTPVRERVWTVGPDYPLFANSVNRPIYRIEIAGPIENGSVATASEYVMVGTTVPLNVEPDSGYMLKSLSIRYSTKTINESGSNINFIMPEYDVEIGNIVFTERPDRNVFTVTFILNGGNIEGSEDDLEVMVDAGEKVSPPDVFLDAYALYAWYQDENFESEYDLSSAVFSDLRLYARWTLAPTVSVTFDLNDGGSSGAAAPELSWGWKGRTIDEPSVPEFWPDYTEVENIILYGTRFSGWFTEQQGGELWDFENDIIPDDFEGNRLLLYARWEKYDYFATGTDAEAPCRIPSAVILIELRKSINSGNSYEDCYFILTGDIDLSRFENWAPIGIYISDTDNNPFSGHFDGGGFKIDNLRITGNSISGGLFGYMYGGSLRNLSVSGNVSGGHSTAGILGFGRNIDRLDNLVMSGNVAASGPVPALDINSSHGGAGGIAGYIVSDGKKAAISDCVNYADVAFNATGYDANLGGIVGQFEAAGSISNCINYGKVEANRSNVGGIVGNTGSAARSPMLFVVIIACRNYGQVKNTAPNNFSYTSTGGIAGRINSSSTSNSYQMGAEHSSITSCKNYGTVISSCNKVGGVVGRINGMYIGVTHCSNFAPVFLTKEALSQIGGVVGQVSAFTILDGNVNTKDGVIGSADAALGYYLAGDYTGGVFGRIESNLYELINCYNEAAVNSSGTCVGGVAGWLGGAYQNGRAISGLYNLGDVYSSSTAANNYIGGIAGQMGIMYSRLQRCWNGGNITGYGGAMGGITGDLSSSSYISHCYNVGKIETTATSVNGIGGITGVNIVSASDPVLPRQSFCHNYGQIVTPDGVISNVGAISGTFSDRSENCFYLSEEYTLDGGRTMAQFASGEVAFALDSGDDEVRTAIWSQGSLYPIFAGQGGSQSVFKITVEETANGNLTVTDGTTGTLEYAVAGRTVTLAVTADDGFILRHVNIAGSDEQVYDSQISGKQISFTMPATDILITPAFERRSADMQPEDTQLTVTFDTNEGDQETWTESVLSGDTVARPAAPTREGYVFRGWQTEDGARFYFSRAIFQNLTLFAQWENKDGAILVVSFNMNGSADTLPAKQEVEYGGLAKRPVQPVWVSFSGNFYIFNGWYTEAVYGKIWDFELDTVEDEMMLYAHWARSDEFSDGFTFTSYDQLLSFAEKVNGGNGYHGVEFYLGADIMLKPDWPGIGNTLLHAANAIQEFLSAGSMGFYGIFHGNWDEDSQTGPRIILDRNQHKPLFVTVGDTGKASGLRVEGELGPYTQTSSGKREMFGGIVGANYGTIIDCHTEIRAAAGVGEATPNVGSVAGGIAGASSGNIIDCTAMAQLYSDETYIGGITGGILVRTIKNCVTKSGSYIFSSALDSAGRSFVGGISGLMSGNRTTPEYGIYNCVVEPAVTVKGVYMAGGITTFGAGTISDCISYADLYAASPNGITGSSQTDSNGGLINNCYWYGRIFASYSGGSPDRVPIGGSTNSYFGFADETNFTAGFLHYAREHANYKTSEEFHSGYVAYLLDSNAFTTREIETADGTTTVVMRVGEARNVWTQEGSLWGTPPETPESVTPLTAVKAEVGKMLPMLGLPSYYRYESIVEDNAVDEGNYIEISYIESPGENVPARESEIIRYGDTPLSCGYYPAIGEREIRVHLSEDVPEPEILNVDENGIETIKQFTFEVELNAVNLSTGSAKNIPVTDGLARFTPDNYDVRISAVFRLVEDEVTGEPEEEEVEVDEEEKEDETEEVVVINPETPPLAELPENNEEETQEIIQEYNSPDGGGNGSGEGDGTGEGGTGAGSGEGYGAGEDSGVVENQASGESGIPTFNVSNRDNQPFTFESVFDAAPETVIIDDQFVPQAETPEQTEEQSLPPDPVSENDDNLLSEITVPESHTWQNTLPMIIVGVIIVLGGVTATFLILRARPKKMV